MRQANTRRVLAGSLVLLLLFLYACRPGGQDLPFETIAQDANAVYTEEAPTLFVIANDEEAAHLGRRLFAHGLAVDDRLQEVDYDHAFVILALQGYVLSTGHSITVQRVVRQGKTVVLQADLIYPGSGVRVGPMSSSPYHLILVSKDGTWGHYTRFILENQGSDVIARTTHFIP